jgi:hypothetical protein
MLGANGISAMKEMMGILLSGYGYFLVASMEHGIRLLGLEAGRKQPFCSIVMGQHGCMGFLRQSNAKKRPLWDERELSSFCSWGWEVGCGMAL